MRYWLLFVTLAALTSGVNAQDEANYFIEAEVDNLTPFVGEQVIYTFRLYSKVSRTQQGSIIDPDFEGFWQQTIGPVRRYLTFVDGQSYDVTERRIALFPVYEGQRVIESAVLLIPDNPGRPGEALFTDSITINARELPPAPELSNFTGAVGLFEMQPTLDRLEIQLGEPVTLRLTIRGSGNIEQLPAPKLPETRAWRIFKNPGSYQTGEADGLLIGEKTFEWLLTPIQSGTHALPDISITWFDPTNQAYQSASATATTVHVLPADDDANLASIFLPTAEPLPLKPIPASLRRVTPSPSIWFWLLWLIPPGAVAAIWWERHRRWERQQNAQLYQRSEALKRALKALAQAHQTNEPYRLVRNALLTYFADKVNTTPQTLSYLDIEGVLRQHGLVPEYSTPILASLEQIDRSLYAPDSGQQNPQLTPQTARLLEALDRRWKS